MKRFAKVDNTSVLQQHYEKKLMELEQEKKSLLVILLFLPVILRFQTEHFFLYLFAIDRKKLMSSDQISQIFPPLMMMVLKS